MDDIISTLLAKDRQYVWHPCTQMKDLEKFPPLPVMSAQGSYFQLADGRKLIDAISSWWCKLLGHGNPRLKNALIKQLDRFEHVLFANTTHDTIVQLSERLSRLTKNLNKVFYASDGSSAVEIAMKMSLHARQMMGDHQRKNFIALENSYHGETTGALSVSDVGIYRDPYQVLLFPVNFISPLPYVKGIDDPLWQESEFHWQQVENKLQPLATTTTAVIVEPILQGGGGMKIYSADFLRRLRIWTQQNNIHLIADEIMTGLGRTGKILACHYANIEPDFLCLAKNLTAGWLPMSAMLTRTDIYELFYDDYHHGKSFLHSHTFSGNPLAASIANEVLNIIEEENICERAVSLGKQMQIYMQEIAEKTGKLINIRAIGAMVAADLRITEPGRRVGFEVFQKATELGAYLRPLGNTIYWLPPVTMDLATLRQLKEITQQAIRAIQF